MFRHSFIAIITLRVLFCPLLCIGCDDGVQSCETRAAHVCNCADGDREPCKGGGPQFPFDGPTDCPCPCDTGCVCQVTPELNNRTASIDFALAVDFVPVCVDTLDFSQKIAFRGEDLSHRLDLTSGRSVRLAHASLLL